MGKEARRKRMKGGMEGELQVRTDRGCEKRKRGIQVNEKEWKGR